MLSVELQKDSKLKTQYIYIEMQSYTIGHPFPEERYISAGDCVVPRITPHSFDIVMTLTNITPEEKKAIISDKFFVSLFIHKQIPHIVFDFGVYKCNVAINIQKIRQVPVSDWLQDEEASIILYLLEEVTGKILGIRICKFPLMTELKYLLRLQKRLTKEMIDTRIFEGESINTVQEMLDYSIFFGEVPESGIAMTDTKEIEEDIIF